jgi:hypothetical protein
MAIMITLKALGNFEGIDQIPVFMDELDFPLPHRYETQCFNRPI